MIPLAFGESSDPGVRPFPKTSGSVDAENAGHDTEDSGRHGHSEAPAQSLRDAFSVGLMLLGSVLVCGGVLLGLVVFWGHRTRRLARQPLPPVAPRDELWFLKPKKELLLESDIDVPGKPNGDQE